MKPERTLLEIKAEIEEICSKKYYPLHHLYRMIISEFHARNADLAQKALDEIIVMQDKILELEAFSAQFRDPHGCNNCGKAIIDPDNNLAVGCDSGDMDMIACIHFDYWHWERRVRIVLAGDK